MTLHVFLNIADPVLHVDVTGLDALLQKYICKYYLLNL